MFNLLLLLKTDNNNNNNDNNFTNKYAENKVYSSPLVSTISVFA